MFELIDTHPNLAVQESEYKRLLGYPGDHVLNGRVRELADWTRRWYAEHGRPWVYVRQAGQLDTAGGRLRIDGTELASNPLLGRLIDAQAHAAMLVAVSAGRQCEHKASQLWQEGKPDEYFFMEIYGSAVVEHLIAVAGGQLCAWAGQQGMAVLPHYSPGYSGWDVSDQNRLFELIRQPPGRDFPGAISALDSGMLRPKKSLLAVFGITRHLDRLRDLRNLVSCEDCSLGSCQYRRAPY